MKTITLHTLQLRHFMGIKEFDLVLDGLNAEIRGENATGKSTLMNGFLWLLFGKNAEGKADFEVRPIDHKTGRAVSGVDTAVMATLDINGQTIRLKKVYNEVWTKKRGEAKATLTGNETNHFWDDVPVQKKEWAQRIAELVSEDAFRLLTSPTYFASLHWQKRREILLDVCGDLSTDDVIRQSPDLERVRLILNGKAVQDALKILHARKKEINDQIKQIPARIDELSKVANVTHAYNLGELTAAVKDLDDQIAQAKQGADIGILKNNVKRAQADLDTANARMKAKIAENESRKAKTLLDLERSMDFTMDEIKALSLKYAQIENKITELREKYTAEAELDFHREAARCDFCGQDLPDHKKAELEAIFNENKATRLESIRNAGLKAKAELEQIQETIRLREEKTDHLAAEIKSVAESELPPHGCEGMITGSEMRLREAEKALANAGATVDMEALEKRHWDAQGAVARARSEIEGQHKAAVRIDELKAQERDLAEEYENLESGVIDVERFVVRKVELLEQQINSRFQFARFRMFETQINGGIQECCTVTCPLGVPVGAGLNSAACLAIGLDCIKALSEHYGVQAPIFVDNAECAVRLPDPGTQLIKLIVDGNYKTLEVLKND